MTSRSVEQQPGAKPTTIVWRNRILAFLAVAVVVVVAYFILAAFIPRWWAQRIATMSGHGSFAKGIWSGLALGFVCTLVPLLLLLFAALMWRRRAGRFLAGAAAVLAIATAIPNLMTLTIVLGGNTAAHAGERILDVDAPGFRGATLIAAIVAAALFLLLVFVVLRRRYRTRRAAKRPAPAGPVETTPAPPPTGTNRSGETPPQD
ncbi:glucan phosphoethanolaminetransferase (alkaline phosphatase superfamily) [Nocardia transvalensis]|uniref:Glucan phosphoethanolaminetransferase (Alkaline phosphatase superfamily) n=1 Tax=Nocardia transvalensis TaxID=37333 RepID=A0A7W9PKS1_9NOCA|nr:permease [Nocardia transvalensis]MBB5917856.1 glucan phosphoethanolaminetransferase (alkaline phosphatase superfamily) [Nocardia transvalensis]